jgi:ABC-type bacteriocin/lantibiotic exporter with double-glycine peptidase domain
MIYVLAFFLPPLALLLNGQIVSAVINAVFFVVLLVLGLVFLSPWLWLIAPGYAIIAIYMNREDRKHRELVDAIQKHGPPPNWRP